MSYPSTPTVATAPRPPLPPPKPHVSSPLDGQTQSSSTYSQTTHPAYSEYYGTGTSTFPAAPSSNVPPLPPPPPQGYSYDSRPTPSDPQARQRHGQMSDEKEGARSPPPPPPPPNMPQTQQEPTAQNTWLPEILLTKSKDELAALLASPDLLAALVAAPATAPSRLSSQTAALKSQLAANAALAAHASSLCTQLQAARVRTSQRLLAARASERAWRTREREVEAALERFGPRVLHARLGAAIAEQEAVCLGVEESFVEGDGAVAGDREVEAWIRRVREGRRLVWLRRERRARWDEGRVGGWR